MNTAQSAPTINAPASLLRRLGGMLYDGLMMVAIWGTTAIIGTAINHFQAPSGVLWQSLLFLELYFFFAWFWREDGQTVGMMAWRMRVVSHSGAPITFNQATMRFAGALLSFMCLGLGYFWMLVDPDGRTWGDIMSDSRVVVEPKAEKKKKPQKP